MSAKKIQASFFYLCALEGVAVIAALFLIPSEGGTLSPARWVLIGVPFVILSICLYAAARPLLDLDRIARPETIATLAFLALVFAAVLFLLRYLDPQRFLSPYQRLSPILWYLLILCTQLSLYFLYTSHGLDPQALQSRKSIYFPASIAFGILLLGYIFVSITRLGLTFDPAYWGEPGVPLMGWQFALALIGGLLVLCLGLLVRQRILDIAVPIALYMLTVVICLSVPVTVLRNSFYMPITSPANVPYPYADSAYYDRMSQSLLIGHPYEGVIPTRPLYILFLTSLHLLFGQDYARIIVGQTVVLAVLPVVLYALGRKLHSRTAGTVIALFFLFRELTSLLISSQTRVTNTKMLLVDLPTLLLLLLACHFVFRWLERRAWLDAFIAGCMFGMLLLLRTQSMFILPFILLAALLVFGWRNGAFYRDLVLFAAGVAISVIPWLTHNYLLTGEFAFDAAFENKLLIDQYRYQGNAAIQNLNVQGMSLPRVLIEFAIRDPKHVFGFIANHFLATQVNSLLALPLIEPYNGLLAPVNLYWMNWYGQTAWYNQVLLLLYLGVIAVGIGAAWKRWRWLALLPLGFSVGYALATAASRFSSWRYDYPADWIAYFYFGLGFAEILSQAALLFGARDDVVYETEARRVSSTPASPANFIALALLFCFLGFSPWLITNLSAPRYADQSRMHLEAQLSSISNAPRADEIAAFAAQPDSFFEAGRLLYPRYFRQGTGLSSANPSPAFAVRDYSRLGFILLNQTSTPAVFPTKQVPGTIPHASDVIVLGCRQDDHVQVRLVAFPALNILYLSAPLSEPCSP